MAKDPYKYFRIEARELLDGLRQGVLDLEKGEASAELVARLLRFAHTLKGAARVVKLPAIAETAHAIEETLSPHRQGAPVPRASIDALLAAIDEAAAATNALAAPAPEPDAARPAPAQPAIEAVRVEVDEMDRLLESVAEATVQLDGLRRQSEGLERTQRLATLVAERQDSAANRGALEQITTELGRLQRAVDTSVEQIGAELTQVRDATNRLRLTPVSSILTTLERAARDAAHVLGKRVEFRARGGDVRLDAHVLLGMKDALLHVVRNAVAHGIEAPRERADAGKPEAGVVEIRVERHGSKVTFAVDDDGRGIDVAALRRAAHERDGEAPPTDLAQLLLRGGVTTKATVDQVSGRAIGLDVVRDVAARLKAEVSVRSEPGRGTTFAITVPVTLTSLRSLIVSGGGVTGSVPLESVRRTMRLTDAEIARSGAHDTMLFDGRSIPFAPLARVLRRPAAKGRRAAWSAVVVQAGAELAAIGVDELRGTADVVSRPLPPEIQADAVVTGASLDAEGNPELVFDAAGLVGAARTSAVEAESSKARLPVLVIDDSLTTRMLEQSILESAGYEVELATSAEEGLEMARRKRYGVFVVDVEMPGMDGFEFVARTRADAALREVPAILVTSRAADDDRRRGREAGAHAYVVKGEFDQALLLGMIHEIIG